MSKIYLELSGRGQGKTYRLINAIVNYLDSNTTSKCYLFTGVLRSSNRIVKEIEKRGEVQLSQRITVADLAHPNDVKGKRFFDDFEWYLNDREDFIPLEGDYYCSTARKRNVSEFVYGVDKNDILYKLLKFNGGQYVSYLNLDVLEFAKEVKDEPHFKSEFLAQFLE